MYIGSKSYQTRVLQLSVITLIKADDRKIKEMTDRYSSLVFSFSLSYYYSQTVNRNFAAFRFN